MNSFQQQAVNSQENQSGTQEPEKIPARILVVDDESDLEILFRQMFRREIRKKELAFSFVHNGQQALDKLEEDRSFDMVLSDIRMPQMDGLTLLSKLDKKYPTLKAVMVTAYGDMENIRKAMNGGAFDFISKPIQYHDLKATIEKTLRHVKELRELHEAREERERSQARLVNELKKLDKLKDEFLANTSHELRTPLNGIIGIVESQLTRDPDEESEKNLNLVLQSAKRLAHLVNEILDFAKLKNEQFSLKRSKVQVKTILDTVIGLSMPLAKEKGLEIKNELGDAVPDISGDANRVEQIVHNLVGNAVKFTDSGSVTIRSQVVDAFLKVEVCDTGPGIAREHQDDIFEAFQQAEGSGDRAHGGTGLGLSITRKLVRMHGGELTLDSDVGKGSIFAFTLPLATDDNIDSHLPEPATSAASSRLSEVKAPPAEPAKPRIAPQARAENFPTPPAMENEPGFRGSGMPNLVPDRPEQVARPSKAPRILPSGRLNKADCNIMVVDDNPINIQVLVNHLNEYSVSKANSGHEALELMQEKHFDLILLDVMMPGMTGYEVCTEIRKSFGPNELPVLLITAKNQTKDLVMGLESGANDYITKPFAMKELLARVKTHLQLSLLTRNLKEAQSIALENARSAGKADFATSVLHNVGNILSNIKVSCSQAAMKLSQSKVSGLFMAGEMLQDNLERIDEFLTQDPKGKKLPEYFIRLGEILKRENDAINLELENMKKRIFMMEDAIETQQYYAKDKGDITPVVLKDLVEESIAVQSESLRKNQVEIVREYDNNEPVNAHRAVLIQILVNIIKNAVEAMQHADDRRLTLHIGKDDTGLSFCRVTDTGVGIEDLSKLFQHGYSTKQTGHGFGLHYCKEAMQQMGGNLIAESDGQDKGASFVLSFSKD